MLFLLLDGRNHLRKKKKKVEKEVQKVKRRKIKRKRAKKKKKPKTSKVPHSVKTNPEEPENSPCLYCSGLFNQSKPGDNWIKCDECGEWCHENCASLENGEKFVCDLCS